MSRLEMNVLIILAIGHTLMGTIWIVSSRRGWHYRLPVTIIIALTSLALGTQFYTYLDFGVIGTLVISAVLFVAMEGYFLGILYVRKRVKR